MKMKLGRTGRLERPVPFRDAWTCVIATEGARTEPLYFLGLQERAIISPTRIKLVCLPTTNGKSAPQHVLTRLNEFVSAENLKPIDQLWLVIDADNWIGKGKIRSFRMVVRECEQKHYRVAMSNPCFELWLILHFRDDIEPVKNTRSCVRLCQEAMPGYAKSKLDTSRFTRKNVLLATARARTLTAKGSGKWPALPGTHVYRLMEQLVPDEDALSPASRGQYGIVSSELAQSDPWSRNLGAEARR